MITQKLGASVGLGQHQNGILLSIRYSSFEGPMRIIVLKLKTRTLENALAKHAKSGCMQVS